MAKKSKVPTPKPSNSCPKAKAIVEIGEPIVKSPLDTHGYKMVRLTENGLKGLLVSTCLHPLDMDHPQKSEKPGKASCVFDKISEFNKFRLNLKPKPGAGANAKSREEPNVNFQKASQAKVNEMNKKRNKPGKKTKTAKVKCRRGVHEQDDDMQTFCNNNFAVVFYIKAGFFQDPPEVPGMAHFCEHVVTLGSKNFPETEAFTNFVEVEGRGYTNAVTDREYTAYFFHVDQEHIDRSLEMFVDLFKNPIFPEKDVLKEIDNINSEFEGKRTLEVFREFALFQSCMLDGHPVTNFGMGSRESITHKDKDKASEIMARLLEWMGYYYCTENMLFGMQGPMALVELEQHFSKHFSKMPRRFLNPSKSTCPSPTDLSLTAVLPPIVWGKWNRLFHMVSSGNDNFMTMSWALEPKFGGNHTTKPIVYFGYILGKKEPGSLDWYLREQGWIIGLSVNVPPSPFFMTEYYTIFSIHLDLTAEGLKQRMKVVRAVFSYVKLLQMHKASERIFDEIRQIQSDIFHYRSDLYLNDPTIGRRWDDSSVNETCIQLLQTIGTTDCPSNVLLNTFLVSKYDSDLLNEFVNSLKANKVMVVFASKIFEGEADQKEKWYQTPYFTKPLCPYLMSELDNTPPYKEFSFPKPNPFVAVSCCSSEEMPLGEIEKKSGLLIYESPKGYVTYENTKCQKCLLPSAEYAMRFMSPVLEDDMDLLTAPSTEVMLSMLRYVLDIELGPAISSLFGLEVSWATGSINIDLSGPSPKLPQLTKNVLDVVKNFEDHVRRRVKAVPDLIKMLIGAYRNVMDAPEPCAHELLNYIMNRSMNFLADYAHVLENAYDEADLLAFVRDFLCRIYILADLKGCVTKSQASEFAQHLDGMEITPYQKKIDYEVLHHAIQLPVGERCLLVKAKNKENRNVVVVNYYQVATVTRLEHDMLNAIIYYLNSIYFEELRFFSLNSKRNIHTYDEAKQGTADARSCGYINEKIDEFIINAYKLCFSSNREFQNTIMQFAKEEGPVFKLADVKKFYESRLLPTGQEFRKLSIQIKGSTKSAGAQPAKPTLICEKVAKYSSGKKLYPCGAGPDGGSCGISTSKYLELCLKRVQEENGYFITDVRKFKSGQPCYGIPEPFSDDDEDQ